MKRFFHIIFIIGMVISFGSGQSLFPILGGQRSGTSVFTFLNIGVSARAVGMGESVVALNQDASSVYYNPAAIAQLDKTDISISQIQWPADINYDYFSMTRHMFDRHYFGVSAGILHMKPMMETTEYHPDGTGNYFTFQNRFIGMTYGAKMTDRFSFGITLKYVSEDLADYGMKTVLMDMGTFYWTGYKSLRFCASLAHFGKQVSPTGSYQKRILDKNSGLEIVPDVILVPLVAFDIQLNRIGYGKGYYDKSLKKLKKVKKDMISVGMAYSFQKCKKIPIDKHDFNLDYIFTEKGIISSN